MSSRNIKPTMSAKYTFEQSKKLISSLTTGFCQLYQIATEKGTDARIEKVKRNVVAEMKPFTGVDPTWRVLISLVPQQSLSVNGPSTALQVTKSNKITKLPTPPLRSKFSVLPSAKIEGNVKQVANKMIVQQKSRIPRPTKAKPQLIKDKAAVIPLRPTTKLSSEPASTIYDKVQCVRVAPQMIPLPIPSDSLVSIRQKSRIPRPTRVQQKSSKSIKTNESTVISSTINNKLPPLPQPPTTQPPQTSLLQSPALSKLTSSPKSPNSLRMFSTTRTMAKLPSPPPPSTIDSLQSQISVSSFNDIEQGVSEKQLEKVAAAQLVEKHISQTNQRVPRLPPRVYISMSATELGKKRMTPIVSRAQMSKLIRRQQVVDFRSKFCRATGDNEGLDGTKMLKAPSTTDFSGFATSTKRWQRIKNEMKK